MSSRGVVDAGQVRPRSSPGLTPGQVRVRRKDSDSILNSKHRSQAWSTADFFVLPAAAQGTGSPCGS